MLQGGQGAREVQGSQGDLEDPVVEEWGIERRYFGAALRRGQL